MPLPSSHSLAATSQSDSSHDAGCIKCSDVQVIDDWSGRSFRLLALARGVIRGVDPQSLAGQPQEQVEKQAESFELLGLLVLSNQLREDSIHTVGVLQRQ